MTCPRCGMHFKTQPAVDIHEWLYHMSPAARQAWVLHEKPERVAAAATVDPFKMLYTDGE